MHWFTSRTCWLSRLKSCFGEGKKFWIWKTCKHQLFIAQWISKVHLKMYCDNDYNVLEIWILTPDYRRKCNFEYNDTSANKKNIYLMTKQWRRRRRSGGLKWNLNWKVQIVNTEQHSLFAYLGRDRLDSLRRGEVHKKKSYSMKHALLICPTFAFTLNLKIQK